MAWIKPDQPSSAGERAAMEEGRRSQVNGYNGDLRVVNHSVRYREMVMIGMGERGAKRLYDVTIGKMAM